MQVALFQLDNYGPWTTTPEPRPEPTLQALQSRLYADFVEALGDRGGYGFYGRFDNLVGITNGLDRTAHRAIQQQLGDAYPVTVSVGIGTGETPGAALGAASEQLQAAGGAQTADRTEALVGDPTTDPGVLQVAHFDIVDVTQNYTNQEHAYETMLQIQEAISSLSMYLYETVDAITFFVGGDNAIAIAPDLDPDVYATALEHLRSETGVEFRVGIGRDSHVGRAGMAAKDALERCRQTGTRIEGLQTVAQGD